MFDTVLVANRGEIARRIIRSVQALGCKAVAVYSEADEHAPHVREADETILIGPAAPAQSYLDGSRIIEAARSSRAQAIHPGYGFLAENPDFARAVESAGLTWIGPSPDAIVAMGDKINARNLMQAAGVPVASGTPEPLADVEAAVTAAAAIGYPVMVKAAAGGGGIGMGIAADEAELRTAFETARTRAERFFGSPAILLERYLPNARHVEIQILGLADGRVIALGERDCSVQRRHQKVAEESPSPAVGDALRARMIAAAIRAGEAVGYRNAGTVECLVSGGEFVFLEMNARLQVEHPITELVTGIDIVAEQLRIAAGEEISFDPGSVRSRGHAIELRVYAEDPIRFLPGPGTITRWKEPAGEGIRIDSGYAEGDTVTPFYDPLIAKIIAWGETRDAARDRLGRALADTAVLGLTTNLGFLHH
ncbi:MAG: acetyl-CoA carboxylase, biotin carboxylase subunit, partial [Frankiaceae bacterium]|nr:acetyl-CoA carboxylase, biotin carboxylase subunit [Frankiaceae bacterium]